jgi:ABC-type branched-subunit amino acid transport system ATPase component
MAQRIATAVEAFPRAGVTVLLVEHNLGFVDAVCNHVVVMAVGKPIASGAMADLRMDATVVDAYLGTATGV